MFKDNENTAATNMKHLGIVFSWWTLQHHRRKRLSKLENASLTHLRAMHEGNELILRWVFVGWRLCRLMATAISHGLGVALSLPPSASCMRKLVAQAWLKLGRLRLGKERLLEGVLARRNKATAHRVLYGWRIAMIVHRNTYQKADFHAQVRNVSKWIITCFHLWARQAWSDSTEREVTARVQRCSSLRIEQEKIWKLRVAELENAITEAKRCKRVKEALNPVVDFRDLARASQTGDRGRSHFPDWKPARGKKIPGFFRPPQTTG
jgi:hypothetical protein